MKNEPTCWVCSRKESEVRQSLEGVYDIAMLEAPMLFNLKDTMYFYICTICHNLTSERQEVYLQDKDIKN